MKKLLAVLAGLGLFVLVAGGFKLHMNHTMETQAVSLRNHRTYERFWSRDVQKHIIDENTLPIFGSSELVPICNMENDISNFLNGEEMNVVTMGAGYFQSLSHAIALGAISDSIPSKKVALFLSPQWFGETGVDADAFASKMSEDELLGFLNNPQISDEHKNYVLNRVTTLLAGSPTQLKRVQRYQNALQNKFSLDAIYFQIMDQYWRYRSEFEVYRQLNDVNNNLPVYKLSELDFEEILQQAEMQGEAACTNNDFGIRDDYWDNIKEKYEQGEVLEKKQYFTESPEYADLDCFLSVADECGIEVLLVSIPVHERWYDYVGIRCEDYYQKMADFAAGYDNVTFIDMTEYADEKYFLRDIMHLGWKGWTRINEKLYQEFTEQ